MGPLKEFKPHFRRALLMEENTPGPHQGLWNSTLLILFVFRARLAVLEDLVPAVFGLWSMPGRIFSGARQKNLEKKILLVLNFFRFWRHGTTEEQR